jgi:hypothetical protein
MPPCRTNLSCFKETCLASEGQARIPSSRQVCVTRLPNTEGKSRRNFEYSLTSHVWGSPEYRNSQYGERPQKGDIFIVGDGCWRHAPDGTGFEWAKREKYDTIIDCIFDSLIFFRITEDPHPGNDMHWRDEIDENKIKYDFRFSIDPLCRVDNVPVSEIPESLRAPFSATLSRSSIPIGSTISDDDLEKVAVISGAGSWYNLSNLPADHTLDCSLPVHRTITYETGHPSNSTGSHEPSAGTKGSNNGSNKPWSNRKTRTTRQRDTLKRLATEQYAVDRAVEYYESHGWNVDIHGVPFDLLCTRDCEELRVEVKGTTQNANSVVITRNERSNAHDFRTDLFIVHSMTIDIIPGKTEIRTDKFGTPIMCPVYRGTSGIQKVIHNWVPDDSDLDPAQYDYTVPKDLWEDPVHGDTAL